MTTSLLSKSDRLLGEVCNKEKYYQGHAPKKLSLGIVFFMRVLGIFFISCY
jgi:hypothetical protein